MDFLEFSVNGRKWHAQAVVDYHSTYAAAYVVRSRASAPANVLQYLNQTDGYVTSADTSVRCKHDCAR